jgi:hypothetical protein
MQQANRQRAAQKRQLVAIPHNAGHGRLATLGDEMFEPIRRRSVEANAPLVETLGVSRAELKRMVSICRERPDLVSPELKRAVTMTALRGATRF